MTTEKIDKSVEYVPPADINDVPQLLDSQQVADVLRVSRDLVLLLARCGELRSLRIGTGRGRVLFDPRDVAAFIEARRAA